MKASDLRNMELKEMKDLWESLEEKLFNLRFQSVTEEIKSPSEIHQIRKDIARIKTVLRERELHPSQNPEGAKTEAKTDAEVVAQPSPRVALKGSREDRKKITSGIKAKNKPYHKPSNKKKGNKKAPKQASK